jgi:hypothetical protein
LNLGLLVVVVVLRLLVGLPLVLLFVQRFASLLHRRFDLVLLLLQFFLLGCEGLNDLGIALPLT